MKLNLNIGPLGPDGTIKLQAFVALALQGEQGIQGPQGDTGPQGPQGEQGPGIAPDDPRLTDAREWTAGTVDQAEAEAGTATTRKAWTAQRVFQAIAAWWAGSAAKTKLDSIATGATANATDAALRDRTTHTGTQAISTVAGLQTALDGKVAGPASSVDGQVMVFSGASGKLAKSGGALGSAAFTNVAAPSVAQNNSRLDGGSSSNMSLAAGVFNFYIPNQNTQSIYGGVANAGTFYHDNSTNGGSGPALTPTVSDLLTASGRSGFTARYGLGFHVAEVSALPSGSGGIAFPSKTMYLVFGGSGVGVVGINNRFTYVFWLRAIGDLVGISDIDRSGLYVGGVSKSGKYELSPSDGWVHVRFVGESFVGYHASYPGLHAPLSGKFQIALPLLFNKEIDIGIHRAPMPMLRDAW